MLLNTRRFFPVKGLLRREGVKKEPDTCRDTSATADGEEDEDPMTKEDLECGEHRHPDEGQVVLDTRRSFVSYPRSTSTFLAHISELEDDCGRADLPPENKLEMQADLEHLIVGVLRLYPTLSYFQVSSFLRSMFQNFFKLIGILRRGITI